MITLTYEILMQMLDADAQAKLRAEFKNVLRETFKEEMANFTPPAPQHNHPEYLTRIETAKLYRISLVTLNEWEKNGLMPKKITVNGRVRFRRDEILATLETAKQLKHKKRATA